MSSTMHNCIKKLLWLWKLKTDIPSSLLRICSESFCSYCGALEEINVKLTEVFISYFKVSYFGFYSFILWAISEQLNIVVRFVDNVLNFLLKLS